MNIYFIISSLIMAVVAQEPFLNCTYYLYEVYITQYRCDLTIYNPNGFNNFTEIGGIHLEGFTNADIGYVRRVSESVSTDIPSIVCETFPNLKEFYLPSAGLSEIDDSTFRSCSRITTLLLNFNSIASISSNAFVALPNITRLYLRSNLLTTLPEDVFAAQRNLAWLDISSNPFQNISDGVFRPLENLEYMDLSNASITTNTNHWFVTNKRLYTLYLRMNRITLTTNSFIGLERLDTIDLSFNGINEIPIGTFAQLPNLRDLRLGDNNITELRRDLFSDLGRLVSLFIDTNPIQIIREGAFRGLVNLKALILTYCRLQQIESYYFEDLGNLTTLNLSNNEIKKLPLGVFTSMPNLNDISMYNNRLKTLRRNSFGTLTSLSLLHLDGNIVNAIDRAIVDDAVNLNSLNLYGNLCANGHFVNFQINRDQHLLMLESCFRNMRYFVDIVTDGDDEYSFFEAPNPGIAFRVNTTNEVQIALTIVHFLSYPMIEIIIASTNNTRSIIRMNEENVVNALTPNIITRDQWNDFRITWANNFIQLFRGNNTLPLMGYYMQNLFPVNFYGLRSVKTSASWSVKPIELQLFTIENVVEDKKWKETHIIPK